MLEEEVGDDEEGIHKQPPLFVTEFVLQPAHLRFSPDNDDFQNVMTEVIRRFQNTVLSVMNLVPDTYFDAFTRSVFVELRTNCRFVKYAFCHICFLGSIEN